MAPFRILAMFKRGVARARAARPASDAMRARTGFIRSPRRDAASARAAKPAPLRLTAIKRRVRARAKRASREKTATPAVRIITILIRMAVKVELLYYICICIL